ncbi:MFS transporter [Streptosporangium canum]
MVAALAVTQTIGYGVLYYAFSVFLTPMARDLNASGTQIAAALTGSILIAALCAPLVGRRPDAHGGRGLMTAGSVLGTGAVLAWSRVDSLPQLYAVFAVIGIACSIPPAPTAKAPRPKSGPGSSEPPPAGGRSGYW